VKETRLGPDHPDTLLSSTNLAAAYNHAGRVKDAIRLHESTLKRYESRLGPDHPHTLLSRDNLAAAYWTAGQFDRSIPMFEETLKLREAKQGPDHPLTLVTLANLGSNKLSAGLPAAGARLLQEALRRARGRPDALAFLKWVPDTLAVAYYTAGQFDRSEPLLRDQLERARKQFGPADSRTAQVLAQLGTTLLKQSKWAEAEPFLRACLETRQRLQPDAWNTFNARSLLGGSLLGQGKYAEAEPLVVSGFDGMQARAATIPPQGRPFLSEAALRVVRLYEGWGKAGKATEWKAKLGLADLPAYVFARP
jgi:tetratricopeptide (TPR) repeat protein